MADGKLDERLLRTVTCRELIDVVVVFVAGYPDVGDLVNAAAGVVERDDGLAVHDCFSTSRWACSSCWRRSSSDLSHACASTMSSHEKAEKSVTAATAANADARIERSIDST